MLGPLVEPLAVGIVSVALARHGLPGQEAVVSRVCIIEMPVMLGKEMVGRVVTCDAVTMMAISRVRFAVMSVPCRCVPKSKHFLVFKLGMPGLAKSLLQADAFTAVDSVLVQVEDEREPRQLVMQPLHAGLEA